MSESVDNMLGARESHETDGRMLVTGSWDAILRFLSEKRPDLDKLIKQDGRLLRMRTKNVRGTDIGRVLFRLEAQMKVMMIGEHFGRHKASLLELMGQEAVREIKNGQSVSALLLGSDGIESARYFYRLFKELNPRNDITVIDQDAEKVRAIQRYFNSFRNVKPKLTTNVLTADALELKGISDNSMDYVFAHGLIGALSLYNPDSTIDNYKKVFRAAFRVLRPHGRLIVVEFCRNQNSVRPYVKHLTDFAVEAGLRFVSSLTDIPSLMLKGDFDEIKIKNDGSIDKSNVLLLKNPDFPIIGLGFEKL